MAPWAKRLRRCRNAFFHFMLSCAVILSLYLQLYQSSSISAIFQDNVQIATEMWHMVKNNETTDHSLLDEGQSNLLRNGVRGKEDMEQVVMAVSEGSFLSEFDNYYFNLNYEQVQITPSEMCGKPWQSYLQSMQLGSSADHEDQVLIWTVSGGPTYRKYIKMMLDQWKRIEHRPLLVVALDQETADHVCALGYNALYWDVPQQSYSRVADAKFLGTAEWSSRGINNLFLELDVFCRKTPVPLFLNALTRSRASLVRLGHYNAIIMPNIGMYYVKSCNETADFFRSVAEVLKLSLNPESVIFNMENGKNIAFFDQWAFSRCLMDTKMKKQYVLKTGSKIFSNHSILARCKRIQQHVTISNLQISSNHPPVVHETTYCIHPLQARPFVPFENKLAIAKILGFDPVPIEPGERFIKTWSGEIDYTDVYSMRFLEQFPYKTKVAAENFKCHFAAIAALAIASNRTLLLPRHIRDGEGRAYPVYSAVDVSGLDDLGVRWRYIGPDDPTLIRLGLRDLDEKMMSGSTVQLFSNMVESERQAQACVGRICEILNVARVNVRYWPSFQQHLQPIVSNLTWCLDRPDVPFAWSTGGFFHPCSTELQSPIDGDS